jgi:hypothetical protein
MRLTVKSTSLGNGAPQYWELHFLSRGAFGHQVLGQSRQLSSSTSPCPGLVGTDRWLFKNMQKRRALLIIPAAVSSLLYASLDEQQKVHAVALANGYTRVARLVSTAAVLVADYKWTAWRLRDDPGIVQLSNARRSQAVLDRAAGEAEKAWKDAYDNGHDRQRLAAAERAAELARREASDVGTSVAELQLHVDDLWLSTHERNSLRLLPLCKTHRGVYIKLAQHLSQMDYLLPRAYTKAFAAMLDDAPQSEYSAVRNTVKEELGAFPEVS